MPFIPFLIFGAVAAAIAAARASSHRTNSAWAAAARELGITLKPTNVAFGFFGKLAMTGTVHGMDLTIDTHQSSDNTFTRYRVDYPSLGLGLTVKREHAVARIGKFFGYQDIEVGDPVFDEAIILKGDYPDRIAAFLTPARRVAITGLIELHPGAVITDTRITYSTRGLQTDTRAIVSTMQRVVSVAQELHNPDHINERAMQHRLEGDAGEALAMLEKAGDTGDPFVDFLRKQQVGEIRRSRGDTEGARTVFQELERTAPADPEIKRWAAPKAEPAAPVPPATNSGNAPEVADHLFAKENYSFDTMEIFESEYEGTTVAWSGILKRLRRFDYDRDFGDGPGVKAVFSIATLGTDLYAGREVDAIVRLPHGAEASLDIGQRYQFSGVLSRCDPAMRNLFVSDATLT